MYAVLVVQHYLQYSLVIVFPAFITQSLFRADYNSVCVINMNGHFSALKESGGSSLNDIAEYILTSCNVELNNGVNLIKLVKTNARQAVRTGMLVKNRDNLYKVARGWGKPPASAASKSKVSRNRSALSKDDSSLLGMFHLYHLPLCK